LKSIFIILLGVLFISNCLALGQDDFSGMTIESLNSQAIVPVLCYDSSDNLIGQGTGFFIWDYVYKDSLSFVTATHVLKNSHKIRLSARTKAGGFIKLHDTLINLIDMQGRDNYLTYKMANGQLADLCIVRLLKRDLTHWQRELEVLPRSYCVFDSTLFPGDHILAIGYANPDTFDFVLQGMPFFTGGIVAYKTRESYLIDKEVHKGMSGGLVYKEFPAIGQFTYKALGIVSADLSRYHAYAWVTKLDYIDSVYIQNYGIKWGQLPKEQK